MEKSILVMSKILTVILLIFAFILLTALEANADTSVYAPEDILQENTIVKAIDWLKINQCEDGSWENGNEHDIIAASQITRLLASLGNQEETVAKSIYWINSQELLNFDFIARVMPIISEEKRIELKQKILASQNIDGGWGISEGYESEIISTCLILEVLMTEPGFDEEIHEAVNYLISVQNQDGSWGLQPNSDGSIYATALARAALFSYKEKIRIDISEVLEKSSQWLLGIKNEDGIWGDAENNIYLSAFAFKALNIDKWQDVSNVPEKISALQMDDGSWEENPYLTSLALEVLLSNKENTKIELKDLKIYADGIETNIVNEKEIVEILPVYTGRDVQLKVTVTNPDGASTSLEADSAGRYLWPSQMNTEGTYSAEVILENGAGETVGTLLRDFTILPYIQVNDAYIEITPGSSKLNKPVDPVIRLYVKGEFNIASSASISLEILAPDNSPIESKLIDTKLLNGENIIDLGNFTPNTSSEGTYNISAAVFYEGSEIVSRTANFKVLEQISSLYTYDEDFDKGIMSGVNHTEVNDQLQLNKSAEIFPYIWIANADEGTLSKLDTRTGKEIARYRTGSNYRTSPSRTTVDKDGSCWVANRNNGTVVKVAMTGGIDKNNNGKIDTSWDANGNGIIESSEMLPWGQDEAIIAVANVGSSGSGPRGLVIDKNNRLWVGLYNENRYVVLNAEDGSSLGISIKVTTSPYGASIDSSGILWSSGIWGYRIEKIDTNSAKYVKYYSLGTPPYGIVVDKNGIVWTPGYQHNAPLVRFDPSAETYTYHYGYGDYGRGVCVDSDGNVWVAYSSSHKVSKFDSTGKYLLSTNLYPQGQGPIGVGVDGEGNIWAVNQTTSNAAKIRSDGTIIGVYPVGRGPYTYSDMTGFHLKNITTHEGTWTVVHDGAEENYEWSSIIWHEQKPPDTDIIVIARAANDPVELISKQFTQVQNGAAIDNLSGRFIQAEVRLKTSNLESPILEDISFGGANSGIPVADAGEDLTVPADTTGYAKVMLDGTNSYDPDGDKLTYKWTWNGGQAEGPQPEVILPEGTTKVTLIVNDSTYDSNPDDVYITVVGNSSFKSLLTTDKTEYSRDETVNITVNGRNESSLSKQYTLSIDILDNNNNPVTNIVQDMIVDLSGGQEQEIKKDWNAGSILAGSYIVRAVWKENSSLVVQDMCNITITPDKGIVNKVTTDKANYDANEDVNITETVSNTSTNSILNELTIITTITDPQGAIIWNQSNTVNEILPNGDVVLKSSWNTLQSPAGVYTVTSAVYKNDIVISEANTLFTIDASSAEGVQGINGILRVKTKNIYPADDAVFDYDLTNTGNVSLDNLTARIRIVDVATETVLGTLEDVLSLGLNETVTQSKLWTHEALYTGSYLVVFDVVLSNGNEVPIGSGSITVEKPYETTINQVVRPRVLVWAESEANIDLTMKTLDDMQVFYQIVNTREDFMTELRTAKYNLYMILNSKLPLTGDDDKELAAEVAKGKGIIVSGVSNGDNLKNLGLFGVEFKGSTTPNDYTVDFDAESVFGQITLYGTGKAQEVSLADGQQHAELNSQKGTSPGVITFDYQDGKSLLFTFDIGSCTGETEQVLEKAIELTAPVNETGDGYAEFEIKVDANTAIGAEIKLNVPQESEVIWTTPDLDSWNFDTAKGQDYIFRVIMRLPQETGQYPITVDSYYLTPSGMFKFDSAEAIVNLVQNDQKLMEN